MLNCKKIKDELPNDGDMCLLCGENGFMQGPICWRDGMWIDLFGPMASAEAGITIKPDTPGLVYWAIVNEPDND